MAEDVTPLRAGPEPLSTGATPVLVEPAPNRSERARRSSYRTRFAVLYVLLAVVLGGAVGAFLVLSTRTDPVTPAAWSGWAPEGRENQYPDAIAEHVAPAYRLPSGRQLAGVLAGPAEVRDLPIRAALIQHASSTPTREDDVEVVEIGSSVMYTFCGVGDNCAIAEGEWTAERFQLLRREALELALYTFTYVDGVDSVIALLPVDLGDPATEEDDSASALFLQKKDFAAQLDAPLTRTLGGEPPVDGSRLPATEEALVERLTGRRHYRYDLEPTQDLGAILRLEPFAS
jgi:hypothetical protein